jgi:hypothetical protein
MSCAWMRPQPPFRADRKSCALPSVTPVDVQAVQNQRLARPSSSMGPCRLIIAEAYEYAHVRIRMHSGGTRSSAPIRATTVKSAYGSGPVTTRRRAGLTVLLDPSSQLPGSSRRAARGPAGAPAAAQRRGRTSLTPASGGRSSRARKGSVAVWIIRGRVRVPGAWPAEWSHKHPSGAALVCGRLP